MSFSFIIITLFFLIFSNLEYQLLLATVPSKNITSSRNANTSTISTSNKPTFKGDTIIVQQRRKTKSEGSKYTINPEDVRSLGVGGTFSDATQTIKILPGVITSGDFAQLYLRGGQPYETLYIIDNAIYPYPYLFGSPDQAAISKINEKLVDTLSFYSGGFPAYYGRVLSGVLDASYINGDLTTFRQDIDFSLLEMNHVIHGPFIKNKASWLFNYRRTYYDIVLNAVLDGDNIQVPFFESYISKLFVKLSPLHDLTMEFQRYNQGSNISSDNLEDAEEEFQLVFDFKENYYSSTLESFWSANISSTVFLGYQYSSGDFKSGSTELPFEFNYTSKPINSFTEITYDGLDDHQLIFGFAFDQLENNFNSSRTIPPTIENPESVTRNIYITYPSKKKYYLATYIQDRWTPFQKLAFDYGIRFARIPGNETRKLYSVQPRFKVYLGKRDSSVLTFSYGRFSSFVKPLDSYNSNDGGKTYTTLASLMPEYATHYTAGYEYQTNNYFIKSSIFYKQYEQLVYERLNTLTGILEDYDNSKYGHSSGLEILFQKKKTNRLSGWVSYTLANVRYHDSLYNWYYADHDQRHTLNLITNYSFSESFTMILKWLITTGKPYTFINGNLGIGPNGNYLPNLAPHNRARYPFYSSVDLWFEYSTGCNRIFAFIDNSFKCKVYVGAKNLLNRPNVSDYKWKDDYTTKETISFLPRLPILGVSIRR